MFARILRSRVAGLRPYSSLGDLYGELFDTIRGAGKTAGAGSPGGAGKPPAAKSSLKALLAHWGAPSATVPGDEGSSRRGPRRGPPKRLPLRDPRPARSDRPALRPARESGAGRGVTADAKTPAYTPAVLTAATLAAAGTALGHSMAGRTLRAQQMVARGTAPEAAVRAAVAGLHTPVAGGAPFKAAAAQVTAAAVARAIVHNPTIAGDVKQQLFEVCVGRRSPQTLRQA